VALVPLLSVTVHFPKLDVARSIPVSHSSLQVFSDCSLELGSTLALFAANAPAHFLQAQSTHGSGPYSAFETANPLIGN
jgi:hypothetical protein